MAVPWKCCRILVCTAEILRRHGQVKFRLEAVSLPQFIKSPENVGKNLSNIVTGHVEHERRVEETFALFAIVAFVHFRVGTNSLRLSPEVNAVRMS